MPPFHSLRLEVLRETTTMAPNVEASYACAFIVLFAFGAMATYYTVKNKSATASTEAFITARGTQGFWRVFWSFYAGSIGAWAVFLPASYTSFGK